MPIMLVTASSQWPYYAHYGMANGRVVPLALSQPVCD